MPKNTTTLPRTVALLGHGSWGSAIAIHLAKNGHDVVLWGKDAQQTAALEAHRMNNRYLPGIPLPRNLRIHTGTLETLLQHTQDILVAVPSHGFSGLLNTLKPFWSNTHRLAWLTKGLDEHSGKFLHEIAAELLGAHVPAAVLSGPSFAKEVAQGLPTAIVVASKNTAWANHLVQLFCSNTFRAYLSQDILGVQLGGVIKNVMAVAAGISDGLGFGSNARAALITRGIAEMIRLGDKLGTVRETLFGLAGCGDMILTCTDNQSRNRRFGLALAAGKTSQQAVQEIGQVVEAIYNIDKVYQLALNHGVDMPISHEIYRILHDQTTPQEAVNTLFSRTPGQEYVLAN